MSTKEECHCCEKMVNVDKTHWLVHITTDLEVVAFDYDGDDSQGWFPVGPSCRKKYPLAFRSDVVD